MNQSSSTPVRTVECGNCQGRGETAVPGTYGATVSPEALETVECVNCRGEGEVAA